MSAGIAAPLIGLWLRRFARMLLVMAVALASVQVLRRGWGDADYLQALWWSAIAAALSASINTWWASRRGCGLRR